MQQGLLHLHNFLRWFVLLFAVLTLLRTVRGIGGGKEFVKGDRKMGLFLLISADLQLLLGLALYFTRGWIDVLRNMGGAVMSDKYNRFFAVEHSVGMLLAIVLIHIGYSGSKKAATDSGKFKKLFWYTLVALLIILVTIPWPFRELIGRPLFPGMH